MSEFLVLLISVGPTVRQFGRRLQCSFYVGSSQNIFLLQLTFIEMIWFILYG